MRWLKRKTSAPADQALPARDPLAAVPLLAANVEFGTDNLGLIQLRRRLEPKGPLTRTMTRWAGLRYAARLNLDAAGSFFWRQIDGRRTLDAIAAALAAQFAWSTDQARTAVLEFTRVLMLRHLIRLQVEAGTAAKAGVLR